MYKPNQSLLQPISRLCKEASQYLKSADLTIEGGNMERLSGVELRKIDDELTALRSLVNRAFERFTDNDMQPPNHLLEVWLSDAKNLFESDSKGHSKGQQSK